MEIAFGKMNEILSTATNEKLQTLNENIQSQIVELESVIKEDNNRIKYTVHESLKSFDDKNNKIIDIFELSMASPRRIHRYL